MNLIFVERIDKNSAEGNDISRPLVLCQLDGMVSDLDSTSATQASMFVNFEVTLNKVNRKPRNGSLVMFADQTVGTLSWGDKSCTVYIDGENDVTFEVE